MTKPNIDVTREMPTIESVWRTGTDFLLHFIEREDGLTLRHPVRCGTLSGGIVEGTLVAVLIRFLDRDVSFRIHAHVSRLPDETMAEPTAHLALLKEERPRHDMVVACAEGEEFPYVRRGHERVPCFFPARLFGPGGKSFDAVAIDISESGTYLATDGHLPQGVTVTIVLYIPNNEKELTLCGRVIHATTTEGLQRGVGVTFEYGSSVERQTVREQVRLQKSVGARVLDDRQRSLDDVDEFKALCRKIVDGQATRREHERWLNLKEAYSYAHELAKGRRRFARAPVKLEVSVVAQSCDLSAGGIRLTVPRYDDVGHEIELRIRLPRQHDATVIRARVVWAASNSVGFEFLDIPENTRDRIDAFVWSELDLNELVRSLVDLSHD